MNKLLILKNDDQITISNNGKKLIIDKNDSRFILLKDKTNDEIELWFINRK